MERYHSRHAAVAALAGAVANAALLELWWGRPNWFGVGTKAVLFFVIGYVGLRVIGLPLVRRLAAHGRDTLRAGLLYGAVCGGMAGAAVAVFVGLMGFHWTPSLTDPDLNDPLALGFVALLGVPFGLIDGAVAGTTLVWCGRHSPQTSA